MPIESCKQKIGAWEGVPGIRQTTCFILSYLIYNPAARGGGVNYDSQAGKFKPLETDM